MNETPPVQSMRARRRTRLIALVTGGCVALLACPAVFDVGPDPLPDKPAVPPDLTRSSSRCTTMCRLENLLVLRTPSNTNREGICRRRRRGNGWGVFVPRNGVQRRLDARRQARIPNSSGLRTDGDFRGDSRNAVGIRRLIDVWSDSGTKSATQALFAGNRYRHCFWGSWFRRLHPIAPTSGFTIAIGHNGSAP